MDLSLLTKEDWDDLEEKHQGATGFLRARSLFREYNYLKSKWARMSADEKQVQSDKPKEEQMWWFARFFELNQLKDSFPKSLNP